MSLTELQCQRREAHGAHFWVFGSEYLDCYGRSMCADCAQPSEQPHLLACPWSDRRDPADCPPPQVSANTDSHEEGGERP